MAIEKHYSAKEVLKILGISMSTLQRLQTRGEIVPDWAGGERRFAESVLLEHLQRKRGE